MIIWSCWPVIGLENVKPPHLLRLIIILLQLTRTLNHHALYSGYSKTRPFATLLALPLPNSLLTMANAKSVTVASPSLVIKFPSITTLAPFIASSLTLSKTEGWAVAILSCNGNKFLISMTISSNIRSGNTHNGNSRAANTLSKPCLCRMESEEQIAPYILPAEFCSLRSFFRILDLLSLCVPAVPP